MLKSTSLSFPQCQDDIRFELNENILTIVTRKSNEEKLEFNIVKNKTVTINKIKHIVLTSDNNDVFYIVNNQFHREGDRPAITMNRFTILAWDYKNEKYKSMAKIWMKNGLYHREGDKPALIFKNGSLLWMENGHFKRNPFINASVYTPQETDTSQSCSCDRAEGKLEFHSKQETLKQLEAGLFNFKYEDA